MENGEPYESAVAKAIKELQQVLRLTLPASRPVFMGENSIRKEKGGSLIHKVQYFQQMNYVAYGL